MYIVSNKKLSVVRTILNRHFGKPSYGYEWLRLLVFATIYVFGIKHGVGSEALSKFFHLLRLKSQIGISPNALRRLENEMRSQILTYGEQQHLLVQSTKTKSPKCLSFMVYSFISGRLG